MLRNRKTGAAAHHASAWRPTWSPEPSHLRSAISVAPCFTARKMRAASLRHPGMSVQPVPLDIQCALLNHKPRSTSGPTVASSWRVELTSSQRHKSPLDGERLQQPALHYAGRYATTPATSAHQMRNAER